MELETGGKARPRNVDWKRAAALLYGDWGTSKAYVIGIAFGLAMYGSFWFVLAVGGLTALVGLNYIWVCKYFPEGGGVYSAARAHSRHLALIGGFLLVANYLVTAALSCFEAFVYFGFTFEDVTTLMEITPDPRPLYRFDDRPHTTSDFDEASRRLQADRGRYIHRIGPQRGASSSARR